MQHTAVLKDHTFTRVQLQLERVAVILKEVGELAERLELRLEAGWVLVAMVQGTLEGRGVVDVEEAVGHGGVDLEDGPLVVVLVVLVVVLVVEAQLGQTAVGGRVGQGEAAGDVEAIDEQRLAAVARVLQTVQQLEARRLVHVHQVHVEAEEDVGVGDVLGLRDAAHIPRRSVEGVAQRAHARRDLFDHLPRVGDALDEDEARQGELVHRGRELGLVVDVVLVRDPMLHLAHRLAVPRHPLATQAAVAAPRDGGRVAEDGRVICGGVRGVVALDVVGPLDLQLAIDPFERPRPDVGGDVGGAEVALLGMLVHAGRAFTGVAEERIQVPIALRAN